MSESHYRFFLYCSSAMPLLGVDLWFQHCQRPPESIVISHQPEGTKILQHCLPKLGPLPNQYLIAHEFTIPLSGWGHRTKLAFCPPFPSRSLDDTPGQSASQPASHFPLSVERESARMNKDQYCKTQRSSILPWIHTCNRTQFNTSGQPRHWQHGVYNVSQPREWRKIKDTIHRLPDYRPLPRDEKSHTLCLYILAWMDKLNTTHFYTENGANT